MSIPCGILMDQTSWSACFARGLDLGKLSVGKDSVPCRKRLNRDPMWPCDKTKMGHNAMLSFRMFLIMSSPVRVVCKCLSDFPVLQKILSLLFLDAIVIHVFELSWNW